MSDQRSRAEELRRLHEAPELRETGEHAAREAGERAACGFRP